MTMPVWPRLMPHVIADTIRDHQLALVYTAPGVCTCGWIPESGWSEIPDLAAFRLHQATAICDALGNWIDTGHVYE